MSEPNLPEKKKTIHIPQPVPDSELTGWRSIGSPSKPGMVSIPCPVIKVGQDPINLVQPKISR